MSRQSPRSKDAVVVIVDQKSDSGKEPEFGAGFSDREVRRNFVRKVYTILSIQLLVTISIATLMYIRQFNSTDTRNYFARNRWWALVASLLALIPVFILACFPSTGRTVPTNYILLSLFTLLEGFMIGVISSAFKTETLLLAAGTTTVVVIVITLLATSPLFDITNCGLLLIILTFVHMLMLIIGLIIILAFNVDFKIVNLVLSIAGAFLFSLWLAYDTQLIVGGKSHEMSPEDYVYGAIALYIDITQIFLNILGIFGSSR